MGIFDRFEKKNDNKTKHYKLTTKGFFIGVAEAEAEASSAEIRLDSLFEDHLNVIHQLNNEKFIVLGRKGTGKSAIGQYIELKARDEANLFCKFIRKYDIDLERVVQVAEKQNIVINETQLYKWIILTQFISLFVENEKITVNSKVMKSLNNFIEKNSGFIKIGQYKIEEAIEKKGISIGTEHLKRALVSLGLNFSTEYRSGHAEFYRILPDLERLVLKILLEDTDNQYLLMFDDLDIGLNLNNESHIKTLKDLIRISKYYNNEVFGKNEIESKIIIFLRTDIQKKLIFDSEMPKVFSSYAIELRWYEDIFKNRETKLLLRKFINRRIQVNFERNNIQSFNTEDPWVSFIDEKSSGNRTQFKYIIDQTFFRPRDLILFFKNIDRFEFKIPVSRDDVNKLLGSYTNEMVQDIKGELSIIYDQETIQSIFIALRNCFENKKLKQFSYNDLQEELKKKGLDNTPDIISTLFDYSLIGKHVPIDFKMSESYFRFREAPGTTTINYDENSEFILHNVLAKYFERT